MPLDAGDEKQRWRTCRTCWPTRRRFPVLVIASITPKIPELRTCGRCRRIWAAAPGTWICISTSKKIEETIKDQKHLNANVDFYSASTYYSLGIPIDLFTPIFAVSRMSGWTAHVLEQYRNNRLIRPRADYTGKPVGEKWIPIGER